VIEPLGPPRLVVPRSAAPGGSKADYQSLQVMFWRDKLEPAFTLEELLRPILPLLDWRMAVDWSFFERRIFSGTTRWTVGKREVSP